MLRKNLLKFFILILTGFIHFSTNKVDGVRGRTRKIIRTISRATRTDPCSSTREENSIILTFRVIRLLRHSHQQHHLPQHHPLLLQRVSRLLHPLLHPLFQRKRMRVILLLSVLFRNGPYPCSKKLLKYSRNIHLLTRNIFFNVFDL